MGFRTRNRERAEDRRKFPNESKQDFVKRTGYTFPLLRKKKDA